MPVKTQTQPTALSVPRQSLQQALESLERARAIEEHADKVVQAATAAVERARAELASFDDLDQAAVRSRLAALVGGEPGGKSLEDIREARRQRTIAQEELEAAIETIQVAQRELEEARDNVARAQKVCASHATLILSESATDVIAAWGKANEEVERLRVILRALMPAYGVPLDLLQEQQRTNLIQGSVTSAGLPYGDLADWMHVQKKVGEALSRRVEREPKMGLDKARAYWKTFADAVLADPSTTPAPLPGGDELWS